MSKDRCKNSAATLDSRREASATPAKKRPWLVLLGYVLPIFVALLLVAALIAVSDFGWKDVKKSFGALLFIEVAGFLVLTVALLGVSAYKWLRVMAQLAGPEIRHLSLRSAFFYTTIGASLSLVLVPHVATPLGRALGARFHAAVPELRSAGASFYEQIFDVVVMAFFAGLGLALLFPATRPWLIISSLLIAVIAVMVFRRSAYLHDRLRAFQMRELLAPGFVVFLLALSGIRYVIVAARAFLLAISSGIPLGTQDFLASFSIVQISQIVAITPMGLGITDWTWAGVLSLHAVPIAIATAFVVLSRGLNAASTLACLMLAASLSATEKRRP